MWKLLQDKPKSESILKILRRSKDRKKSAIEKKLEKDLWRFVEDNKTEAWTLLDKRANYILHKTIRMKMEAWTPLDGGRWLYALLHEARIRREIIIWPIEDDEVCIHGSSHKRQYVFSSTVEEDFLRNLKEFLVFHLDPWSYDERKKWNI